MIINLKIIVPTERNVGRKIVVYVPLARSAVDDMKHRRQLARNMRCACFYQHSVP
ncbi:MAG: hypothetical protein LBC68_13620 [Prevotellaceae bacterium]|nr:hypothetical protein [Prevotellaceae bacterium]